MLVSIIVINFNGVKFLQNCLDSVFAETEKPFEVVLVDNGSTDKSIEFIKKNFGNEGKLRLIILPKNVGAAKARNIGVQKSLGRYILILDNDTKIKKGWFDEIVSFIQKHPKLGLAQPKLLTMGTDRFNYAGDLISPFGFLIERARGVKDYGQFDKVEKIFGLNIASAFFRKEVFEKLGGFDEDYYLYWEETDLAWRAWLAGYEVLFVPSVTVWHAYGTKEKNELYYEHRKKFYQTTYLGSRNMITTLIKNLELKNLIFILPTNISCWLIISFLFLIQLKIKKGVAIWKGILWNFLHLGEILRKRQKIQTTRTINDHQLFSMVGDKRNIFYYFGKGLAYVQGKPF